MKDNSRREHLQNNILEIRKSHVSQEAWITKNKSFPLFLADFAIFVGISISKSLQNKKFRTHNNYVDIFQEVSMFLRDLDYKEYEPSHFKALSSIKAVVSFRHKKTQLRLNIQKPFTLSSIDSRRSFDKAKPDSDKIAFTICITWKYSVGANKYFKMPKYNNDLRIRLTSSRSINPVFRKSYNLNATEIHKCILY